MHTNKHAHTGHTVGAKLFLHCWIRGPSRISVFSSVQSAGYNLAPGSRQEFANDNRFRCSLLLMVVITRQQTVTLMLRLFVLFFFSPFSLCVGVSALCLSIITCIISDAPRREAGKIVKFSDRMEMIIVRFTFHRAILEQMGRVCSVLIQLLFLDILSDDGFIKNYCFYFFL